jgi:CheY-like chemotaxis protein
MPEPRDFTILVVDDEELLRKSIANDLKRKGFQVLSCENGTRALEHVRATRVHLVISDIRMPDGDGVTLLEQIRAYDPSIPVVILMTGFSDFSEEACLQKGARAVLLKPFDRKRFASAVFEALGLPDP